MGCPENMLARVRTQEACSSQETILWEESYRDLEIKIDWLLQSKRDAENGEAILSVRNRESGDERPPFDINLAVILAGFAFEYYTAPSVWSYSVTMYNFGSPRVGNKIFAEIYNEMRGEKELVEKILNTEINIFRSIRDGSALMQHMEDFYYITLLENVRSNYQIVGGTKPVTDKKLSI